MTTLREAAQQALEALEGWKDDAPSQWSTNDEKRITTLRAALEQPEQEPVAWIESPHGAIRRNTLYRITAPQSLAWSIPLYAHPPRREWQSLTPEEVMQMTRAECVDMRWPSTALNIARDIEAALKERNHG